MPRGISGVEVAKEAMRARPGIKVLLTSGYAQEVLAAHGAHEQFPFFAKPYKQKQLAGEIRRVLASPRAADSRTIPPDRQLEARN
jgi:DNA-binding LytR/AlgR family response regulator